MTNVHRQLIKYYFYHIETFLKTYKIIDEKIAHWRDKAMKDTYLSNFSLEKWQQMPDARRRMHTRKNCHSCFHTTTIAFPTNKKVMRKRPPFTQLKSHITNIIPAPKAHTTIKEAKEVGRVIFHELESTCKENLGRNLASVLSLVPEAGLVLKTTASEKKKKDRGLKRKFKKHIESTWEENFVEKHLSQRISLKTRNDQRISQSFELDNNPPCHQKSHSPSNSSITGDLEGYNI